MNYTVRERFDEINGQINRVGSDAVNYVLCDETRITVWPDGDSQP